MRIEIDKVIELIKKARITYVFGNGGSASNSNHLANDLRDFGVVSLCGNVESITAIANDFGFERVFLYQLSPILSKDDLVIGISTSGNSLNVELALRYAKSKGATTLGFLGLDGGRIGKIVHYSLVTVRKVPEEVENQHLALIHEIAIKLKSSLGSNPSIMGAK